MHLKPSKHHRSKKKGKSSSSSSSSKKLAEALFTLTSMGHFDMGPTQGSDQTQRTKRFLVDGSYGKYEPFEIYRDLCESVSNFELVTRAINSDLQEVDILPNTWIWTTHCTRSDSLCPSIGEWPQGFVICSMLGPLIFQTCRSDHLYRTLSKECLCLKMW